MIKVQDLKKRYGDFTAVDKINFSVDPGEIFGFLGPNGAGKTTTLEMIEGLRRPDGGSIHIKGIPVWPNPNRIKGLIGVQLQSTSFYEELTVKETISLFSSLYNIKVTKDRLNELLELVGLVEKQNSQTNSLSGGQKQRLAILTTLVNSPEIIFLDEPTTGLDPQARRRIWEIVKELKNNGKTVILTTHYMEEAELLCDRTAIIDNGKIVSIDSPMNLIQALGNETKVSFSYEGKLPDHFPDVFSFRGTIDDGSDKYTIFSADVAKTIRKLLDMSDASDLSIKDIHVTAPTLEDVFITLTGKDLRD